MENPFDFFEEIYCINLDHRKDRWKESLVEFEKLGIKDKVQRFSAVSRTDGRIGVIKSNLEIVKMAKKKGHKNVLVFEDDVKFVNNPIENLSLAIEQLKDKDWELFYLGANTHEKLIKIEPNLIRLRNAFSVHAMAYNQSIYNKFINYGNSVGEKLVHHLYILDVWLSSVVQTNNKSYMVNPLIATQRESYSDIEKQVVKQDYIEERFKNNIK